MEALINHTAHMLASVLNLRREGPWDNTPLRILLQQEVEVFPSAEKSRLIAHMNKALLFVSQASGVATTLHAIAYAHPDENINMQQYESCPGMRDNWTFTKPRSTKVVGDITARVHESIRDDVFDWLLNCDRLMCNAFSDYGDNLASMPYATRHKTDAVESVVVDLARFLSERIASYASLHNPKDEDSGAGSQQPCDSTKRCDEQPSPLSADVLESRAVPQVVRNHQRADANARDCLHALETLLMMARLDTPFSKLTEVLTQQMHHVSFLARNMPPEIDPDEYSLINREMLKEISHPEHDLELRRSLVKEWQELHGASTVRIVSKAIEDITAWMKAKKKPFIPVIEGYSQQKHAGMQVVPPMPFVNSPKYWVFSTPRGKRTGLDYCGRRVVRLTSFVWELLAWGEIRQGVVSARSLLGPTRACMLSAEHANTLVNLKLATLAPGCRLYNRVGVMGDYEGDMSCELSNIFCELSMFSFRDIHSVFAHNSRVAPRIMEQLSDITCEYMAMPVATEYFAIAYDTLRIMLPILQERRSMLGRAPESIPNPLFEVLQTIPKARDWIPLKGKLVLSKEDLNGAAHMSADLFAALQARGRFVEFKRLYIGNGKKSASKLYVFNTVELQEVMRVAPDMRLEGGWGQR